MEYSTTDLLQTIVQPNSTTLVEICVRRIGIADKNVFPADIPSHPDCGNFKDTIPGGEVVEV